MTVHMYHTAGGKNLIFEFHDNLPIRESVEGYFILENLEKDGVEFLKNLTTRQIERKLWEIKFQRHNRMFYVLIDASNIYILHACKKQKGKAERFEVDAARNRVKEI